MALLNMLVLLTVLSLTEAQLAGINMAVLSVGAAVAAWRDPSVPFGPRAE